MKTEDHMESYEEHRDAIFEWAVTVKGLENSQRIVGLHASRGIIDLLSAYLHKKGLIDPGFQINHTWFKTERVSERLPDFPEKNDIVAGMVKLENICENLTYGSPKKKEEIGRAVTLFRELSETLQNLGDF